MCIYRRLCHRPVAGFCDIQSLWIIECRHDLRPIQFPPLDKANLLGRHGTPVVFETVWQIEVFASLVCPSMFLLELFGYPLMLCFAYCLGLFNYSADMSLVLQDGLLKHIHLAL